jgi:hypothetical protein
MREIISVHIGRYLYFVRPESVLFFLFCGDGFAVVPERSESIICVFWRRLTWRVFFPSDAADLARIKFGTHLAARLLFETCLCVQVKREFRWEMPAGSSTAWSMAFSLMDASLGELLRHFLKGRVCRTPFSPCKLLFLLRIGVEEKKRPIFRLYSS